MRNGFLKFIFVFIIPAFSIKAFSCTSWTAYVDADVVAARYENGCVITASINYVKQPKTCSINIKVGTHIEIIAPENLMSSGCPVDGGLFMEGNLSYVGGKLILIDGEVW
jgi:hypothetical protein